MRLSACRSAPTASSSVRGSSSRRTRCPGRRRSSRRRPTSTTLRSWPGSRPASARRCGVSRQQGSPPKSCSRPEAGSRVRIGVLSLQGNFREHGAVLRRLGVDAVEVRKAEQLEGLDGLIIPGGESTAIGRLLPLYGLEDAIRRFEGPVFGTCAGMILLDRNHLGLVDLEVARNAYGRQVASFEADLELSDDEAPLRGVFIRAPRVRDTGADVEVLAELDGE